MKNLARQNIFFPSLFSHRGIFFYVLEVWIWQLQQGWRYL